MNKNVIELTLKHGFIPWYEKMTSDVFRDMVIDRLVQEMEYSFEEAQEKFEEFQSVSLTDERCCYGSGMYSFRYYVMNELKTLSAS